MVARAGVPVSLAAALFAAPFVIAGLSTMVALIYAAFFYPENDHDPFV